MNWEVRRLQDVTTLVNGFPFDSELFSVDPAFPLARIRDILSDDFETFVPADSVPETAIILDGDVVIGMDGDFNVVRWNRGQAALNQRLCLLRANGESDTRFIAFAIPDHLKTINDVTYATTVKHLSSSQVKKIRLPLPPLAEQKQIADFLDRETKQIDNLIAEQEALVENLTERRRSVINTTTWRGLQNVVCESSGVQEAGESPGHWKRLRNKNVFEERNELSASGDEEMLTVSHLTGVTPRSERSVNMFEAESNVGCRIVRRGDLVINTLWGWMGALGVSRYEGIVSPAYGVYKVLDSDQFDSNYFNYLYRSAPYVCEITRYSRGVWSSRLRIYPDSFLAMDAVVPPLEEQREIAAYLDEQTSKIDALIEEAKALVVLLKERRSALISAAVTGKIDVRSEVLSRG